jgi:urea transport system permease protein
MSDGLRTASGGNDAILFDVLQRRSPGGLMRWLDLYGPGIGALLLCVGIPALFVSGHLDQSQLSQIGRYCCLAMVAIGLDLVWGYCGVLSLCQAMFFTLGGYACGMYLAMHGPLDAGNIPRALFVVSSDPAGMTLPWFWKPFESAGFAMSMVILVPGTLAAIFGFFAFRSRIRGVYFSIISQAATVALWLLFCRNDLQLCGTNGLTNFTHFLGFDLRETTTKLGLYILSAVTLCLATAGALWLTRTRFGRLLVAIRDNESRLRFAGYDPVWFKTVIFACGAILAGIGGALYTPQTGIVTPANMMAIESILVVVWVAVGGRGTVVGAVVGALVINLLYAWLTTLMPKAWPFFIGGIFVSVVLFMPTGLAGGWRALMARTRSWR